MNTITDKNIDDFLKRQRWRHRLRMLLLSFFGLISLAGLVFAGIAWKISGIEFTDAVPPLAIALLSGFMLARMWRATYRERGFYQALAHPGVEAVTSALEHSQTSIRWHRRLLMTVYAVLLPLFALSVWQLLDAGKMNLSDAAGFGILLAVIVTGLTAVVISRLRRELLPRREMLAKMLSELKAQA